MARRVSPLVASGYPPSNAAPGQSRSGKRHGPGMNQPGPWAVAGWPCRNAPRSQVTSPHEKGK